MRGAILCISNRAPVFRAQLWILNSYGLIHSWVPVDIGDVVGERAECKSVFVGILGLDQQLADKISAANVVHKVAEFRASERIVAKVLDDGAAIRVGVCFRQLLL